MDRRKFVKLLGIPMVMGLVGFSQTPPTAPTIHSVTLTWKQSNQKVNYRVWRATTQNGQYTQIASAIQTLTYKDTNVVAGKTYYYKVDARNVQTNLISSYSQIQKATIP